MENKDQNINNTDFQSENAQNDVDNSNYSNEKADNDFMENPNEIDTSNQENQEVSADSNSNLNTEKSYEQNISQVADSQISDNTIKNKTELDANSGNDESEQSAQDKNCVLDKAKYEKMKNWFFGSIPFILTAIVISLFNIGKVRQPLSFLFLALGLLELAISNLLIGNKIAKTCTCKNCVRQSKSSIKHSILYGVGAIGFLGLFIFYMVT